MFNFPENQTIINKQYSKAVFFRNVSNDPNHLWWHSNKKSSDFNTFWWNRVFLANYPHLTCVFLSLLWNYIFNRLLSLVSKISISFILYSLPNLTTNSGTYEETRLLIKHDLIFQIFNEDNNFEVGIMSKYKFFFGFCFSNFTANIVRLLNNTSLLQVRYSTTWPNRKVSFPNLDHHVLK